MSKRIMVACNTLTSIDSLAYNNHCQNWYRWGRTLTDYEFFFYAPRRMSIDRMRNEAAKLALAQECDWLFFYDDDVMFPRDTLKRLLEHNKPIVAGLTYVRGYPFQPMMFHYTSKTKEGHPVLGHYQNFIFDMREDGLVKCDAIGFSCVLIDCKLLKEMVPPFFVTGPNNTEDVYFCIKAAKEHDAECYCDVRIHTSHIVDKYVVNHENIDKIRQFEEEVEGRLKEDRIDRGEEVYDDFRARLAIET